MKLSTLVMLTIFTVNAHALIDHEIVTPDTPLRLQEDLSPGAPSSPAALGWDGIYELPADVQIKPKAFFVNGREQVIGENEALQLFEGEGVAVKFEGANAIIHTSPLLVKGEKPKYEKIVLSREDALKMNLKLVGRGDERDLQPVYAQGKTKVAGRFVLRRGGRLVASGCLGWVMSRLPFAVKGGVGGANRFASWLIKNKKWKSVSCSNPPHGTVGSWGGGKLQHTALYQKGKGWCYDQGCHMPGKGYGRLSRCAHP